MAPVPYRTFKFSNGFSSIIIISANLPTSIEPILFSTPSASAPLRVADLIISNG